MIDTLTLCNTQFHKVKLVDTEDNTYIGIVDFYESEYDSGYGVPCIGLDNGMYYIQNEIKSVEIID